MDVLIGAVILWVVPMFVANSIGNAKRRPGILYGFFLGWIGVLILALLPAKPEITLEQLEARRPVLKKEFYEAKKAELLAAPTYRECPYCKENMRAYATVCPHCRNSSPAQAATAATPELSVPIATNRPSWWR